MNLRDERMCEISFTVNTRDQRKENNKCLISLFRKTQNAKNLAQVKNGVFKGKTRFARTRRNVKTSGLELQNK